MRRIKHLSLLFALVVGIALTSGCVSTTLQQIRETSSEISDHESIAILGRLHKSKEETEIDFVDCVSSRTSMGDDGLNVLKSQAFLDSFFPWFEPRTAPRETKELVQFLDTPLLVKRFRDIGLRYIVWIDGQTERVDQSGTLQCAIATSGVPACFGFLSWDGQSNFEATVWDIERGITVGNIVRTCHHRTGTFHRPSTSNCMSVVGRPTQEFHFRYRPTACLIFFCSI